MRKQFLFICLILSFTVVILSFEKTDVKQAAFSDDRWLADTTANVLTAAEKAKGWKLLFDGKTTSGWRTYLNKESSSWTVADGILHSGPRNADKTDKRADIMTDATYENFELSIDWKISPQGNSGILYMVQETEPSSHLTGPEYQIIDDVNFPEKLQEWQKTGANYAIDAAPEAKPANVGEWNHTVIIVKGNHVEHWLNGKKIVDYTLYSDKWLKEKAEGKFKDAATYATVKKGHIALQDHGSEAWFKNIKIRVL